MIGPARKADLGVRIAGRYLPSPMKESPLLTRLRTPAARRAGVFLLALSFLSS